MSLLAATAGYLLGLRDPIVADFMRAWPDEPEQRNLQPTMLPVQGFLGDLRATTGLAADLVEAAPNLAWRQTYGAAEMPPCFLDRYGWTELLGTRGHWRSDELAAGFLLLGPDTLYPEHRHAAEEIYIVLVGTADWSRGGEGWRRRMPGEVVHHDSQTPHAMRTGAEPLLALYLWRGGDLAEKSRLT
ncbi:MAG: dimethylsulfonioproprionate lyase family protein [Geminicoccaceae bacterium]